MKKIVCIVLSLLSVLGILCGCDGSWGGDGEKIDPNRTQLNVASFDGGVGTDWLYEIKDRFEAAFSEEVFEPGKKGVQIMISKGVTNYTSTMSSSNYHVIFDEALSYYDLASSGMLLPITDIVRATGTDGKTIESKLSDRQRQALTALDGEYYALPHYEFYGGVVYDIDVFESKKLYFSNNPDVNGGFIVSDDDTRSAGPDGQPKTSDDGLPADYEQFFALCDYMVRKGVTPFIWTGKVNDYLNYLLQALFLSYCRAEEALYNVTFDSGEGTTEIVSRFENGQPVTERVGITPQTGYLLSRQAGKYYALSFLKTILSDSDYYYRDSLSGSLSHADAQEEFFCGYLENEPIGMLIDGSYWYNEAEISGAVERAVNDYGERAENRRFGWMPLPGLSGATKPTLGDQADSFAVINANIADDEVLKKLAGEFLAYCYTDEMLQQFTLITGSAKAVSYELGDKKSQLNSFESSLWDLRQSADVVFPVSSNPIYMYNQSKFSWNIGANFWSTTAGGGYRQPVTALKREMTAQEYFEGMYVDENSWSSQYGQYFD